MSFPVVTLAHQGRLRLPDSFITVPALFGLRLNVCFLGIIKTPPFIKLLFFVVLVLFIS